MAERDRAWLRTFLNLGARARATVPTKDIERQEDTVLRAIHLLDQQPGVVLADEVGMGKTYEALGVVAAYLHQRPTARTLILTPGPDLNTKWIKELRAFHDVHHPMYKGFADKVVAATTLAELVDGLGRMPIVVAPVSAFAGSRALSDKALLLTAWAESQQLAGTQIAAIFRRYSEGAAQRVALSDASFLGTFDWARIESPIQDALSQHREQAITSLDELLDTGGYDAFSDTGAVDRALSDLRFRLLGHLVPHLDLLVVDEAHKLKNSEAVRSTGVRMVFGGRFDKALFLTATPFQLTVQELRQVFKLFALAKTAPADLLDRTDRLMDQVTAYTDAYDELDRVWRQLDPAGAADFGQWYERDPELTTIHDDPTLRVVGAKAKALIALKRNHIEPGFREWMIRSLRENKREYRSSKRRPLRAKAPAAVPFVLYERFIAELFRSKARTHKAAVQINMVSSYGAAREGALLADEVKANLESEAEDYRKLLQHVVGDLRDTHGGHPKVAHVAADALAAAERNEKTLIFCARTHTLTELKKSIETRWNERILERWRALFPDACLTDIFDSDEADTRGRHQKLQNRFQRPQDALYLALRESYVATLLHATEFAEQNLEDIVTRANAMLSKQRLAKRDADRTDWSILKRCLEQATARALQDAAQTADVDPDALRHLTDPKFIPLGYDLEKDEVESSSVGSHTPTWQIHLADAQLVIRGRHLWSHLTSPLVEVPAALRVRTVERLAAYLVSRYVPFLPDLLAFAKDSGIDVDSIESRALLPVVDRFWTSPGGRPWCDLLRQFLLYAAHLDEERRKEVLDDVVKANAIVRHTADGESRERLREAFNTPLYPMILIANEVMQEGLDLHHHCRRVVHHDLAWNPAQLEQRVGRVDRLGSLLQRMREKAADTKLEIELPLIANTIDERLERTVRLRERWMEFLLGAAPKIEEYGLADEAGQPLPEALAEALRVELGP